MSFQAKVYEINMYLSLKISVGIHPTPTQVSPKQLYNATYRCDIIMTSDIIIGSIVTS